ncbi:beta-ketoacyl synthase N-terminal-like domain-containing protein [Corallococcus terminator]
MSLNPRASDAGRIAPDEPIAIVGIGCRLPGATGPDAFWRMLLDQRDAIREVPPDRFDLEAFYNPDPDVPGRTHSRWGGFLEELAGFDARFFGISPREAKAMDPQQRLLLEVGWDALSDAGIAPLTLRGTRTGTFVGLIATNYWELQDRASLNIYDVTGSARSVLPGRLSFALDLRGPSVSVDAACASSLVAVHLACQSLRLGESELALACGVNAIILPDESIVYSSARMLSTHGRCKFADAAGDGFVRSDGVGVIVLKPLSRARAEGDRVYAVILGSTTNNDGQGSGYLLTPSEAGQVALIRDALLMGNVRPRDLDYIEAHGTGTRVGDAVELRALAEVLRGHRPLEQPTWVGSVKSNIGHTEGAAGIAGLIKTALSLYHERIPASLHLTEPNPAIDWNDVPLKVPTQTMEWPRRDDGPPVAGVSSFGINGTNAHVILRQADRSAEALPPAKEGEPPALLLLPVSGVDGHAARKLAASYADRFEHADPRLVQELCAVSARRRDHYAHRLAVLGTDGSALARALRAVAELPADETSEPDARGVPEVVFVFPGQGSQWVGMGRELLRSSTVFREALEQCDVAISQETDWSLLAVLQSEEAGWMSRVDVVQPVLWALQVSLARLWRSWGIIPSVVLGHSMGEVAAAHVAGILDLSDAAKVICRRSRLARKEGGRGAMAVVELPAADAEARLNSDYAGRLWVAAHNSPRSCVVTGEVEAIDAYLAELEGQNIPGRRVRVDFASHCPLMDPLCEALLGELEDLTPRAGTVRFHSTVRGKEVEGTRLDAAYWAENLRQPVLLAEAVKELSEEPGVHFLEVSPHPVLVGALKEGVAGTTDAHAVLHSLLREQSEMACLLDSLGELYVLGAEVDWAALYPEWPRHRDLPGYPWQHEHFWTTSPAAAAKTLSPHHAHAGRQQGARASPVFELRGPRHPLLGARVSPGEGVLRWEGELDLQANAYLVDHRVQGTPVFPATGYVELVHAAVRAARGSGPTVELRDVHFPAALFLGAGPSPWLQVDLQGPDGDWTFTVRSRVAEHAREWITHATGRVLTAARVVPAASGEALAAAARCGAPLDVKDFYARAQKAGNEWLGAFAGVVDAGQGEGELVARTEVPPSASAHWDRFYFHPATLDACCHILTALGESPSSARGRRSAFLGKAFESVRFHRPPTQQLISHARLRLSEGASFKGDIHISTVTGEPVADVLGMSITFLGAEPAPRTRTWPSEDSRDWLIELTWREVESATPARTAPSRWLVLSHQVDIGAELPQRLKGPLTVARLPPSRGDAECCRAALLDAEHSRAQGESLGIVFLSAARGNDARRIASAEEACHHLAQLIRLLSQRPSTGDVRLWMVTQGAQQAAPGERVGQPTMGSLWGMGRVALLEAAEFTPTLIDLPSQPTARDWEDLARELSATPGESQVALRAGQRWVARLVPVGVPRLNEAEVSRTDNPAEGIRSNSAPHGDEATSLDAPLGLGTTEVLIDVVEAPSVDADSSNLAPGTRPAMAWACMGRIAALGPGVRTLRLGQEVVALTRAPRGRRVVTHAALVVPRPLGWEAATLVGSLVPYVFAHLALVNRAGLRPGEHVLVNCSSTLLTLALLKVAHGRGAVVLATSHHEDARAMFRLAGAAGVAPPGSPGLMDELARLSSAGGFDVVVDSPDARHAAAGAGLLREGGRHVTGGVPATARGVWSSNAPPGPSDLSFHTACVSVALDEQPTLMGQVLREVLELIRLGTYLPLPVAAGSVRPDEAREDHAVAPLTRTAPTQARSLFAPKAASPVVRSDAGYVITGGLGALGRVAADWLIQQGARHLLLVGRTALPPESEWALLGDAHPLAPAIADLLRWRRESIQVRYRSVDVADESGLSALFREWTDGGHPRIRGVIHTAGVASQQWLAELDPGELDALLHAKLRGGWALHRTIGQEPLDFFVLYSSGASALCSPMVGGYAAANASLDALAAHRNAEGLPALSIQWGFWQEVGMAARREVAEGRVRRPTGLRGFSPVQGANLLGLFLGARARGQIMVMPADWTLWAEAYPSAAALGVMRELVAAPASPPVSKAAVARTEPEPTAEPAQLLAEAAISPAAPDALPAETRVANLVADVMHLPVQRLSRRKPLSKQGLDSLMATEVRNRVLREMGVRIPIVTLIRGATLDDVASIVLGQAPTHDSVDRAREGEVERRA